MLLLYLPPAAAGLTAAAFTGVTIYAATPAAATLAGVVLSAATPAAARLVAATLVAATLAAAKPLGFLSCTHTSEEDQKAGEVTSGGSIQGLL